MSESEVHELRVGWTGAVMLAIVVMGGLVLVVNSRGCAADAENRHPKPPTIIVKCPTYDEGVPFYYDGGAP